MTEQEIIEILNNKELNSKTNNYIFTDISNDLQDEIITKINPVCIIKNPTPIITAEIGTTNLNNILIDIKKTPIKEVINTAFKLLEIKNNIPFESKMNLLRLRGLLREHNKAIQFIFYHLDKLSVEEQKLLNEIYWFNTYFFNANALINKKHFITTETISGNMLDYRENYDKRSLK